MIKVLKNLKDSIFAVITIVILLCIQASVDLALPDYTSKIVNTGIQAGGIETAIPKLISKEDMDKILLFTDKDDDILENYTLIENNESISNQEENVLKKYYGKDYKEKTENKSIYILKDINGEKEKELTELIVNPLMINATITNEDTAKQIKEQMADGMLEEQKQYVQSQDLITLIINIPEEQRNKMLEEFTKKIDDMSESIKEQAAISCIKQIYNNLNIDTDKIQNDYILFAGLQMLGVAFISMICAVLIMLLSSKVAAKLGKTLRDKVFKKVINFSNKELSEFSTASLITRSTNDIQQIQQLMGMLFRVVVYAPIMGIGGFIKVLTASDNQMSWIIGVAILAILFIIGTLFIVAMPKFKKLQDLIDRLNLVSREILTGLPVIRAFHKEDLKQLT